MDLDRSAPIVVENEGAQHTVAVTRAAAVMPVVAAIAPALQVGLAGVIVKAPWWWPVWWWGQRQIRLS